MIFTAMDVTEIRLSPIEESQRGDGSPFWVMFMELRTLNGGTVSIHVHAASKPSELEILPPRVIAEPAGEVGA